jgi:PHD/YefM family antitoxin component YafN of YafNO toxin-antitoxin module
MERQYVKENNETRERLKKLVNNITDEELKLVVYKEGWTVAAALAHLAYWDHWSLLLMKKWEESGVSESPMLDWDAINDNLFPNDTILPFLLAIPPRTAANMAVTTAESIDRELETAAPETIAKISSLGDETRLLRSIHRKMHLDEIDALLKARRNRK